LDKIIYEIDKPKAKHLNPTGHYIINLTGYLLAEEELKLINGKWVTEFQENLIDYIAKPSSKPDSNKNRLVNLTVISLNYDRVFEHHMGHDFFKKLINHSHYSPPDLSHSIILSQSTLLRVFKPHGYLCGITNNNERSHVGMYPDLNLRNANTQGIRHPGNDSSIKYGNPNLLNKEIFLRMGRHMYVVDERGSDDYEMANNSIKLADEVYCLGLSAAGLSQSHFNFHEDQKVFVSNKFADIALIQKLKPEPEYVCLSKSGDRLNAIDFPYEFKKRVLV